MTPSQRPIFAGTVSEYNRALVDCLKKAGVNASFEIGPDGRARTEFPAASRTEFEENKKVVDGCRATLPAKPEPKTDADFRLMYDHFVEQSRCVKNEGYDVPPMPSWQSFLEEIRGNRLDWYLTALVPESVQDEVRKKCVDAESWW
ncbi:MAG: hypothetical protein QM619_04995 [Micropruina sp.]|uniref:hypothetical protein n=1 Tax=Micropruina sp. TaxID=2737536 RepID=UPI0039E5FCF0